MKLRIFISSVQREFAEERRMLADYIRRDPLLGSFFSVFLFEESPAIDVSAANLYLPEVESSDIYLGIIGDEYGNVDGEGISPTEREYDAATKAGRERLVFLRKGTARDARVDKFVQKMQSLRHLASSLAKVSRLRSIFSNTASITRSAFLMPSLSMSCVN